MGSGSEQVPQPDQMSILKHQLGGSVLRCCLSEPSHGLGPIVRQESSRLLVLESAVATSTQCHKGRDRCFPGLHGRPSMMAHRLPAETVGRYPWLGSWPERNTIIVV